MQKPAVEPDAGNHAPLPFASEVGARALDVIQTGAARAASGTEKAVRRFPLAAVGLALGGGVALGAIGYRLLTPKPRRTLLERIGLASVAAAAARGLAKLF